METNNKIPKVFISYSWDNEAHKIWVLELADKLTKNGIYVFFDRYDLYAGKDMIYFMETSVRESDKVLLIMTPNYKIKAEKRTGGVGYEASIVTAEIFNNQKSDKFIPIRIGERDMCTPNFIKSKIDIDMSDDSKFDENIDELIRTIYNKLKIKRPPLGESPLLNKIVIPESISNQDIDTNNTENKVDYQEDNLLAYQNYQGGPIPQIELDKYHLSYETLTAQTRHDYLKVIELKLKLAKICQLQGKTGDAYILEEGIRKTYIILSSTDRVNAKMMISQYNEDMSKYIDQDIKRY